MATAPAVAVATIEVPCGVWTSLCTKDQQHTKWAMSALVNAGANYTLTMTLTLDGGDTDDDGDLDISDVTLLVAQFGGAIVSGGCPWDGTNRAADFDNSAIVDSADYTFLTAGWLTLSSRALTIASEGAPAPPQRLLPVTDARTKAADLDEDGRVDVRDVEVLEARHGLSDELSRRMRK